MQTEEPIPVPRQFIALVLALQHACELYLCETHMATDLALQQPQYYLSRCETLYKRT